MLLLSTGRAEIVNNIYESFRVMAMTLGKNFYEVFFLNQFTPTTEKMKFLKIPKLLTIQISVFLKLTYILNRKKLTSTSSNITAIVFK